jgi:hypothetical protein
VQQVFLRSSIVEKFKVVDGRDFYTLTNQLAKQMVYLVEKYSLSQKMVTRLVADAWAQVESERRFKEDSESYIRKHLNEQINVYLTLSLHSLAGLTEAEFRSDLEPLVKKTVDFFLPPAGHPIIDGEFTCLLVLPDSWGCSLRFLLGQLRQLYGPTTLPGFRDVLECVTWEAEEHLAPDTPYVLAGVKGVRGLKECDYAAADKECDKFGYDYLSVRELALLLLCRPRFLQFGDSVIALGDEFGEKRYLVLTLDEKGFTPNIIQEPAPSSLLGVGKPHCRRVVMP